MIPALRLESRSQVAREPNQKLPIQAPGPSSSGLAQSKDSPKLREGKHAKFGQIGTFLCFISHICVAPRAQAFQLQHVSNEQTAARNQTGDAVRRVLVVVNPHAGGVRRHPQMSEELRQLVGQRGTVVSTATPEEIDSALRTALLDSVDTVALCGGDGTNHCTMTSIARIYGERPWPRIALLAGGTVNTTTSGLGFGGDPRRQLANLLNSQNPRVRRTSLVWVNGRVGFILGTQMPARVMDAYYDGRTGVAKCIWLAGQVALSAAVNGNFARTLFEPQPIHLQIDGRQSQLGQATAVVASVVPAIIVGMRATYRAGEGPGFHLLATDAPPGELVRGLGRLWAGLPIKAMKEDVLAHRVHLQLPAPSPFMLDGDVFSASELKIVATREVELLGPGKL